MVLVEPVEDVPEPVLYRFAHCCSWILPSLCPDLWSWTDGEAVENDVAFLLQVSGVEVTFFEFRAENASAEIACGVPWLASRGPNGPEVPSQRMHICSIVFQKLINRTMEDLEGAIRRKRRKEKEREPNRAV